MIIDSTLSFASGQSLSGTTAANSTNVYDTLVAKKLFGGGGVPPKIALAVSAVGGTSPTFRAQLVGADDAALSVNVVIIDDTGVSRVLVAASDIPLVDELIGDQQLDAKRYYGIIFTLGGTSPTATVSANLVADAASNLLH